MLRDDSARSATAAALATRLIVEPPLPVSRSVLPLADPERAAAQAADAGLPSDVLARFGASVRQTHRRAGVIVVDVPAEQQPGLAAALQAAGISARPPFPVVPLLNETVPLLRVPAAWQQGFRGAGIRVAVVDTGVDAAHPDLTSRIAARADFSGAGDHDDVGHGTHVAGIVVGGGTVYRGVAPDATAIVAKALSSAGGTEDAVLAAMSWASRQDVAVLNLSLGGPGTPRSPLAREVDALTDEGIIVCVAAGNAGPDPGTISSPGDARGALTIGAADKTGAIAGYSSRGPVRGARYHKPDLVAIGGGVARHAGCAYGTGVTSARAAVLAADPCAVPPRYVRMSGTSMAAPHVAGICALLLEAIAARPLTVRGRARAVRAALIGTARPVGGADATAAGAGLVDATAALERLTRR